MEIEGQLAICPSWLNSFFSQLFEEKLQNTVMFNSIINFISRVSWTTMTCVIKILWMWGTLPVF